MYADVIKLRDKGWLLPRYRFAFIKPVRCDFLLGEFYDTSLSRTVRIAKLAPPTGCADLGIPPLYDAQVVGVTREVLTVSGIERITDDVLGTSRDYAQTWLVTPVPEPSE